MPFSFASCSVSQMTTAQMIAVVTTWVTMDWLMPSFFCTSILRAVSAAKTTATAMPATRQVRFVFPSVPSMARMKSGT